MISVVDSEEDEMEEEIETLVELVEASPVISVVDSEEERESF